MPRTFTPTERATTQAPRVWHLSRAEVLDVDDTWQDLTDLGPDGVDTYVGATVSTGVDANVWSATVRVRLSYGDASLSPLMAASVFNRDGVNAYAPLLNAGTRLRLWAKTLLPTDVEGDIGERMVFDGRIDRPTFTTDPMTLTCRDLGGKLIDTIISRKATYGDTDDPPTASSVIQQILTDAADLLGETIPLVVPEEPTFLVTERTVENISVFDAIQGVATLFGWVVRYRFQDDGSFALTLYDPLRDKTTPDYTLAPSEYLAVDEAAIDITNVRNRITVWYTDGVTGEPVSITVSDSGSIAAFGDRFMQLGGEALTGISTGNDALALAQFALADLATPLFDHTVTNTLVWFAEIGDLVGFTGNNVQYDDDQALGLVEIVHEFPDGGQGAATTAFKCRGTPAGAYERWLRLQGGPIGPEIPPAPELMFLLGELSQFGGTTATVDGALWLGYRLPVGVDEIRVHVLLGDGPDVPVPNIDGTTLALTIRRPEGDIGTPATGVETQFPNRPGEYASLALLSTRPEMYKRIMLYGVRGGLTSRPIISTAVQAVDPDSDPLDGTIASLTVTRDGGTNTVTVTPGTLETDPSKNGNWLVIERNKHCLPPFYIQSDTTPVVFVDTGLEPSAAATYVYEAFIWNSGKSGPKRRTIADAPTLVAPEFALGTPVAANVGGVAMVQISWTGATPGAGAVRVEASIDGHAVRVVGQDALASGTLYDSVTGPKLYRLVAIRVLDNAPLAYSPWKWYTGLPGTLSNPGALPAFVDGTPKVAFQLNSTNPFDYTIRLRWSWTCATPGAMTMVVQRSDDNGVTAWADVPGTASASVATGTAYSQDDTLVSVDTYYRLQARDAAGTALASSGSTHYVPPSA